MARDVCVRVTNKHAYFIKVKASVTPNKQFCCFRERFYSLNSFSSCNAYGRSFLYIIKRNVLSVCRTNYSTIERFSSQFSASCFYIMLKMQFRDSIITSTSSKINDNHNSYRIYKELLEKSFISKMRHEFLLDKK